MLTFEATTALFLTARFWMAYDQNPATALWHGTFHAISAFNNAGFSVYSDNLIGFAEDPWIITPICLAIIAGGLGFPVIIQLTRGELKPKNWTIHLRLTIYGTLFLLAAGTALFAAFEWNRNETIGQLSLTGKLLGSLAGGVFPRTAGFNSIDYGAAAPETLMVTNILMFIGGGSAGTAGGIKITTFLVLGFAIWNEVRGRMGPHGPHVHRTHRHSRSRLSPRPLSPAPPLSSGRRTAHHRVATSLRPVVDGQFSAYGFRLSVLPTPQLARRRPPQGAARPSHNSWETRRLAWQNSSIVAESGSDENTCFRFPSPLVSVGSGCYLNLYQRI
jgi:hypothetical protein